MSITDNISPLYGSLRAPREAQRNARAVEGVIGNIAGGFGRARDAWQGNALDQLNGEANEQQRGRSNVLDAGEARSIIERAQRDRQTLQFQETSEGVFRASVQGFHGYVNIRVAPEAEQLLAQLPGTQTLQATTAMVPPMQHAVAAERELAANGTTRPAPRDPSTYMANMAADMERVTRGTGIEVIHNGVNITQQVDERARNNATVAAPASPVVPQTPASAAPNAPTAPDVAAPAVAQAPAAPAAPEAHAAEANSAPAPAITIGQQTYEVMDSIRQRAMTGDAQAQAAIAHLDGDGQFSVNDLMKLQLMGDDQLAQLQQIAGTLSQSNVSTVEQVAPAEEPQGNRVAGSFQMATAGQITVF